MGSIIYLDGPEKAGKSTLARYLADHFGWKVRHWGPVPGDHVYAKQLAEDIASNDNWVWDRGWAAEHVYARLLNRDRRLRDDPWLGEWLHGRAVETVGARAILLGPSTQVLRDLRDRTDLAVDPGQERHLYRNYGLRFGYFVYNNRHDDRTLEYMAAQLDAQARDRHGHGLRPPAWAGPPDATVVFLGERRNGPPMWDQGRWLPFASRLTEQYGRLLNGAAIYHAAWTNTEDAKENDKIQRRLVSARLLVACGREAQEYARRELGRDFIVDVPHPAWLYRWAYASDARRDTEALLKSTLTMYQDSK